MNKLVLGFLAVLGLVGLGYEAHLLNVTREKAGALEKQGAALQDRIRRLHLELGSVSRASATATSSGGSSEATDDAVSSSLRLLFARIAKMKTWMQRHPRNLIPELQFLKETDWSSLVADRLLATDDELRSVAREIDAKAMIRFSGKLGAALGAYLNASGGMLPSDIWQLAPYLDPAIDPSILARYEMYASGPARLYSEPIGPSLATASDSGEPNIMVVSGIGGATSSWNDPVPMNLMIAKEKARLAYAAAHDGEQTNRIGALAAYFQNPADLAAIQQYQGSRLMTRE